MISEADERSVRAIEKARYLEVNAGVYADAERRWKDYENLILARYLPTETPANGQSFHMQRALDEAWRWRDRYHLRWVNRTEKGPKKQTRSRPKAGGHNESREPTLAGQVVRQSAEEPFAK